MRFCAPRSVSSSPVRTTFGLSTDSDSDADSDSSGYSTRSYTDSYVDSESDSQKDSHSDINGRHPAIHPPPMRQRTPAQQRETEETVAAIRLRTRYHDPYEEWERETRKDAFRTARKTQTVLESNISATLSQMHISFSQTLAQKHAHQLSQVDAHLRTLQSARQAEEQRLQEAWRARERGLWQRVEAGIKLEEDRVRARVEAARKEQEAAELRCREEEEKRKKEEEVKRAQEEERMMEEKLKEKEEKQKETERKEREQREGEDARKRSEQERAEGDLRKEVGMTTATEDWATARRDLLKLKKEAMQVVKADKAMKSEWGKWRRQITPKIGQLTNDEKAISRITAQLLQIVYPTPPHSAVIYTALLSSLAKSLILQAETEVTAEKRAAGPLARIAVALLGTLEGFAEVLFARIVQRAGGWAVPVALPSVDVEGRTWGDGERVKAMGYRRNANASSGGGFIGGDVELESAGEYTTRVAGVMRVYFHILRVPPGTRPLGRMFQMPRCWVWLARMMNSRGLLEAAVAPQLIYTALDVLGEEARAIYGVQWVKALALLYEGVTVGLGGGRLMGGETVEGRAARVRVQLEIERIMAAE